MGLRVHPDSRPERFHAQMAGVKRLCRHAETLLSARRAGRQRRWPLWPPRDCRPGHQVSGKFMPQKVRIALDAMGGDVGASVVVPGAAMSLARHPNSEFLLFGKRELI